MTDLFFPNNPTNGQLFTKGWSTWMWDGVKWMASMPSGGVYEPVFGGTQYPMYGFLYNKTVGDPGYSAWAGFGAHRWRFGSNPGDEQDAGAIDYRGYVSDALSIVGAGTVAGSRKINLYDNVNVSGNLTVGTTTILGGGGGIVSVGNITATGPLAISGPIGTTGSSAILTFQDRTGTTNWGWYAQAGVARLWNDQSGDRFTVDSGGSISTPGFIRTGSNIYMGGPTLYFSGVTAGGPYVSADSTNMTTQLGSGNGGFYWYSNPGSLLMKVDSGGTLAIAQSFNPGYAVGAGDVAIELGLNRTGSGNSYIDFHSQPGTDFDFRVIRAAGPNGAAQIINNGVGALWLQAGDAGSGADAFQWYNNLTPTAAKIMHLDSAGRLFANNEIHSQGGTASLWFQDRGGAFEWAWYSDGNQAHLYNTYGGVGRVVVNVDINGQATFAQGVIAAAFQIGGTGHYIYDALNGHLGFRAGGAGGPYGYASLGNDGIWTCGEVDISGWGVRYNGLPNSGHAIGFGWDGGRIWGYVDGGAGSMPLISYYEVVGVYLPLGGGRMTGQIGTSGSLGAISQSTLTTGLMVYGNGAATDASYLIFHRPSQYAVAFGLDTDNQMAWGGWSYGAARRVLWDTGNFNPANYLPLSGGTITGNLTVTNSLYANQQIFMPLDNWLWQGGRASILQSSDGNFYIGDGGAGWNTRLRGVTVFIDGPFRVNNSDNSRLVAPNGQHARMWYEVSGTRLWSCGCINNGWWYVADESVGQMRFQIDTNGNATIQQSLTCGGNVQANGSTGVNGIWWGNNGGWWWTGTPVHTDSAVQAGLWITAGTDIGAGGQLSCSGNLNVSGTSYLNGNQTRVHGTNANDSLTVTSSDYSKFLTVKPETQGNWCQIGYYCGSGIGWGTSEFVGQCYFDNNINCGDFYSRGNVNSAGVLYVNGLMIQNYTGWWWTANPIHTDSEMACSAITAGGHRIYDSGGWEYHDAGIHANQLYSRNDSWCANNMTAGGTLQANGGGWSVYAPNGGIYSPNEVHGGLVTSGGDIRLGGSVTCSGWYYGGGNGGAQIRCWAGDWGAMSYAMSGGTFQVSPDQGASGYVLQPVTAWSDARLKLNIRDSEIDALAVLGAIPVRAFEWTERGRKFLPNVGPVLCGIVAQEIQELIPNSVEAVGLLGEGMLRIVTDRLDAYYIRAFQQLAARVKELEDLVLNPPERNLA